MSNSWIYDFRIAYKRLIKRYKTDSEEYIFALSFLVQLSLFHTISGSDLYLKQQFVQMTGDNLNATNGFNSMQLQNRVRRIMVAKYNEIAFLLIVKGAVKDIQKSLLNHGFSDLITFDGSGGLFVARNSVVEKYLFKH